MKVLLSGATGFIGSRLAPRLVAAGHQVVAMTRSPGSYDGPGTPVVADVSDSDSLVRAMVGCEAAYYLVHGMDDADDFADEDAVAARRFGAAAAEDGLDRIIYLGGLGRAGDDLSDHLASRQEVEGELSRAGVPVTTLRAALVIGQGSASFELLRQVVQNLPLLVLPPRAKSTRVQPISLADTLRYLLGVLDLDTAKNATFEIGGPEVLTYADLLHRMAAVLGSRRPAVSIPVLPPAIAKLGVRVVTDVEPKLAASLLESLGNDVVATDNRIRSLLPGDLVPLDDMLAAALGRGRTS